MSSLTISAPSKIRLRVGNAALLVFIATGGFALNLAIDARLGELGIYDQPNLWFGLDPNYYLRWLADGEYWSKRHPLLQILAGLPAYVGAAVVHVFTAIEQRGLREDFIRLIAGPLAASLKTILLFTFLRRLGVTTLSSFLILLIDIASLSRIAFASVTESFSGTAAALVAAYSLASGELDASGKRGFFAWAALGLAAFGITITNLVFIAVLFLMALDPAIHEWKGAFKKLVFLIGSIVIVGATLHGTGKWLTSQVHRQERPAPAVVIDETDPPEEPREEAREKRVGASNEGRFHRFSPMLTVKAIPSLIAHTFASPLIKALPLLTVKSRDGQTERTIFRMNKHFTPELWPVFLLIAICAGLGAINLLSAGRKELLVCLATAAIVTWNLFLFGASRGDNLFLYTLHWQPCFLVLFGGFALARAKSYHASVLLGALLTCELYANIPFLKLILWA
jgi:hypothetical protein